MRKYPPIGAVVADGRLAILAAPERV